MAKKNLTIELASLKEVQEYHLFTVNDGLSREQFDKLRNKPPYTPSSLYKTQPQFVQATGDMAGWPYENIVTEAPDETVFAIPDSLFDHIREDAPEVVARKLARMLGAIFIHED
jgi:hypothetical protein